MKRYKWNRAKCKANIRKLGIKAAVTLFRFCLVALFILYASFNPMHIL
ncbi:MAG: hypothetical protein IKR93_08940 [Firmicutes bacterium]|nr:hypothetical protein [Bacillota bacterium]